MSFKPPVSSNKVKRSKFRAFDGIGGPLTQVLKRFDPRRGYDISNTVFNNLEDFNLGKYGEMSLRNGKRKISDTGESAGVDSIIMVNLGSRKRYAVKVGDSLVIHDIPVRTSLGQSPLDFSPAETRGWTVGEIIAAGLTVTQLKTKTVNELITGHVSVTNSCPASYTGDPL